MEAVGSLAAQNPGRQVERHVVGVIATDTDVAGPHLGLHGIRLVDDDDAACRIRWLGDGLRRDIAALPVAEDLGDPGERLLLGDVANDGEDGVVWHEVPPVKREQVVT